MRLFKLLVSFGAALAVVFVVGYIATLLVRADSAWWLELRKPAFLPGNIIFQICWMVIYVCLITALTVNISRRDLHKCLMLWGVVLPFNVLWCAVFFVWNLALLGLAVLVLQVAALIFITSYYIKNTKELWISMIPILAWYGFLFVLNYGMVMMN